MGIGPGAGRRRREADQALGPAATAGRFAKDDLVSILEHLAAGKPTEEIVRANEAHSVRSGTIAWQALGQQSTATRKLTED